MKKILLVLGAMACAGASQAETFAVDTDHAEIGFTVRHLMISDVKGGFNTFQGTIDYDLEENNLVSVEGWIDTASIDTNSGKRDNHLKEADFFHVAQYPKMVFKSTTVEKTGENSFRLTGKLSVLGVDRDVTLPVTVAGPIDDPWGNKRIGLSSSTILNRRDLGITSSPATMISDEVRISITAEATYRAE